LPELTDKSFKRLKTLGRRSVCDLNLKHGQKRNTMTPYTAYSKPNFGPFEQNFNHKYFIIKKQYFLIHLQLQKTEQIRLPTIKTELLH